MKREAMPLYDFLKAALSERQWSIPAFARRCGVSPQLGYKWLADDPVERIVPGPRSCEKIAAALGLDADVVLELAGHRHVAGPKAWVAARRQARSDQLEQWNAAVGPDYEDLFWESLKSHADAQVRLIERMKTAVNAVPVAAVSVVVEPPRPPRRPARRSGEGPLAASKQPPEVGVPLLAPAVAEVLARANARLAA